MNLFFDEKTYINQFMGAGGVGQAIEDFYGDNFDHGPLGFIGGGVIWGRQTGNGPVRGIPLPSGSPNWGSGWKAAVKEHFLHTGRIESQSSNMAYRGCYLDLDPTYRDAYGTPLLRMTLNWQDNDMRVSEFLGEKLAQIGKAMGAKSMSGRVLKRGDNWDTRPYQSTHINGGTAMGADPKTSVINKYLQSWDVPNLFVLGANVFAHGIGYNPTGLVGGLAYWAAANIRSTYLKRPRSDGTAMNGTGFARRFWVAATLVLVVAAAALFVIALHVPNPGISPLLAQRKPDMAHGKYVAVLGDCAACHTAAGGQPFAGGVPFSTPVGTVYSTNITPDHDSGIGNYSFEDFVRVMRLGVTPEGTRLYPAMPYTAYAKVSDEDLQDLFAYLQLGLAPAHEARRPSAIPWPLSIRWPLALLESRVSRRFPLRGGWFEGRAVEPWRLSGPGAGALRRMPHSSRNGFRGGGRLRKEQPLSVRD